MEVVSCEQMVDRGRVSCMCMYCHTSTEVLECNSHVVE